MSQNIEQIVKEFFDKHFPKNTFKIECDELEEENYYVNLHVPLKLYDKVRKLQLTKKYWDWQDRYSISAINLLVTDLLPAKLNDFALGGFGNKDIVFVTSIEESKKEISYGFRTIEIHLNANLTTKRIVIGEEFSCLGFFKILTANEAKNMLMKQVEDRYKSQLESLNFYRDEIKDTIPLLIDRLPKITVQEPEIMSKQLSLSENWTEELSYNISVENWSVVD